MSDILVRIKRAALAAIMYSVKSGVRNGVRRPHRPGCGGINSERAGDLQQASIKSTQTRDPRILAVQSAKLEGVAIRISVSGRDRSGPWRQPTAALSSL